MHRDKYGRRIVSAKEWNECLKGIKRRLKEATDVDKEFNLSVNQSYNLSLEKEINASTIASLFMVKKNGIRHLKGYKNI